MNSDEEIKYDAVLKELTKLVGTWQAYQVQITAEIVEYKKTINSAISLLAQEAFKFQSDTKERLTNDAAERTARQQHVDTLAERRDRADVTRRADASAEHLAFQKRAGRERFGIMGLLGCLIVTNLLALIALAVVLIVMNWK